MEMIDTSLPRFTKRITEKRIKLTLNLQIKPKKKIAHSISLVAKQALERGGGRACKATHGGGCRHFGILDLKALDKANFLFYLKKGGWLENKDCLHCGTVTKDMKLDKLLKSF